VTSPESTPDSTPQDAPESRPDNPPQDEAESRPENPPPDEAESRPESAPRPVPPRPRPPVPGPPRRPTPAPPSTPPAAAAAPSAASAAPPRRVAEDGARWGRVGEDGTVYVRTADGERAVGQMPDVTPDEALDFFVRRFADLVFEVELLERRIGAGSLGTEESTTSIKQVRSTIQDAHAVGDLAGLEARLDALTGVVDKQREQRRQERARRQAAAKTEKERIAAEAETLADGSDWRNGANRLRQLLDEWKALPRLDKADDDALWRRFSTARTTYTRRRKTHFADLNEQRDSARVVKERLAAEAESLAGSTEWGATAGRYRELMRQWKAAGPAPKGIDDQLWKRFRTAQDSFFGARDRTNAEIDREFAANARTKEALLAEAEALLPVTDLRAAKEAFRSIAERWDAAGKVPRERVRDLENRMRAVEQAIRGIEDDQWHRSNPEARARAAATVAQLQTSIAELEARRDRARTAGDEAKAAEHAAAAETRRSWLIQAEKALEEFGG
jgi:uncharacterized protein DUF349